MVEIALGFFSEVFPKVRENFFPSSSNFEEMEIRKI
jgi:hypothetical protein